MLFQNGSINPLYCTDSHCKSPCLDRMEKFGRRPSVSTVRLIFQIDLISVIISIRLHRSLTSACQYSAACRENGRCSLSADSPLGRFLAKHPTGGLHHLCLSVPEVAPVTAELRKKGVRILGDGKPAYNVHGQQIAFISPSDFFGSLVEIEQQQSRESGGSR